MFQRSDGSIHAGYQSHPQVSGRMSNIIGVDRRIGPSDYHRHRGDGRSVADLLLLYLISFQLFLV